MSMSKTHLPSVCVTLSLIAVLQQLCYCLWSDLWVSVSNLWPYSECKKLMWISVYVNRIEFATYRFAVCANLQLYYYNQTACYCQLESIVHRQQLVSVLLRLDYLWVVTHSVLVIKTNENTNLLHTVAFISVVLPSQSTILSSVIGTLRALPVLFVIQILYLWLTDLCSKSHYNVLLSINLLSL